MAARTFTVASILILMAIASSEGATPVEAKVAPVGQGIYQSNYEAPIETTQQEVEDGADDVFDMLLQVPEKVEKAKLVEEKLAPNHNGMYATEYVAPPTAEETLDSMDSVFDSMVQVDATYEDSRPTPTGEETEGPHKHHMKHRQHHIQHQRRQHHMKRDGAEPVKAKKFHGKDVKQVTVLEEAGHPDDQEREPEDDSFDADEQIGAGDGDFVEEDDDEFKQEQPRAARPPPAAVEEVEVKEDAPKKAAPKPVNIGLTEDKQATVALAAARPRRSFSIPAARSNYRGDNFEVSTEGGNIVNPDIKEMKRDEAAQSKRRVARRARANVYLAAYKKLEHGGDTKEDKYHRAKAMNRATEQLDEIQGINPLTGHVETWMSKCSDGDEDC